MKVSLEMTRHVGENAGSSLVAAGLASTVIYVLLNDVVPTPLSWAWIAIQISLMGLCFYSAKVFNQLDKEDEQWAGAVRRFTWSMLLLGLGWGTVSVLAAVYGALPDQVAVLAILLGLLGAAIGTVAPLLNAYTAFLCATMSLQIFSFLIVADKLHFLLALATAAATVIVYTAASKLAGRLRALVENQHRLISSTAAAQEANRAKTKFLSEMSHALRTPLNAVLGFAQLFDHQDDLSPKQREYAAEILLASKQLLALITDISVVAKRDAAELEIDIKSIALAELLAESQARISAQAEQCKVTLHFEMPQDDLRVRADVTKLKQVLHNLLASAVNFNVINGAVDVTVQSLKANTCRIQFSDTGKGISSIRQAQLCASFNRMAKDQEPTADFDPALVASKNLIEQMGGAIGFDSKPEKGCNFWIDVPLATDHQTSPGA